MTIPLQLYVWSVALISHLHTVLSQLQPSPYVYICHTLYVCLILRRTLYCTECTLFDLSGIHGMCVDPCTFWVRSISLHLFVGSCSLQQDSLIVRRLFDVFLTNRKLCFEFRQPSLYI